MERRLDALERMWGLVEEWQGAYAGWKETKFREIKVGVGVEVARGWFCGARVQDWMVKVVGLRLTGWRWQLLLRSGPRSTQPILTASDSVTNHMDPPAPTQPAPGGRPGGACRPHHQVPDQARKGLQALAGLVLAQGERRGVQAHAATDHGPAVAGDAPEALAAAAGARRAGVSVGWLIGWMGGFGGAGGPVSHTSQTPKTV